MGDVLEKPISNEESTMKKDTGTNRIHVSYPDRLKDRFEEIKAATDKNSMSEVFRTAMLFYSLAYEEHKKGSDFLIRDKDGQVERLRMFM